MKKIGSISLKGMVATIYYDDKTNTNPFRLYAEYYTQSEYGYPMKHRKIIAKYGDLASCTAHIHNFVLKNNIERM